MHSTGEPVFENGKVTRLIGNTLDITEHENALDEIRRLKDELYKENIVLREEINSTSMFEEVLGNEREQIEAALAQTKGKASGRHGAAAILGMPASTLESKIRALRINKHAYKGA